MGEKMYVTVERPADGTSISMTINFSGRKIVTVREILWEMLGIQTLLSCEKIWIRRENEKEYKKEPYKMMSQLPWEDFNKCIIVLSPDYPFKKIEEKLNRDVKLLKKKRERHGPPRSVQIRNQAKITVIRRQRKKRLAQQKKDPDT